MEKFFIRGITDKFHRNFLKYLNKKAMSEKPEWRAYNGRYHKAILLGIRTGKGYKIIGYLMWSGRRKSIISRQIYILKEYRRQGAATFLIQNWHRNITAKSNRKLYIEKPEPEILSLLIKIGYAHKKKDEIVSDKFLIC